MLTDSSVDFFAYSRLEESEELTTRQGTFYFFTPTGIKYFSQIPNPFFLIYYLLTRNQGEKDLVSLVRTKIKNQDFIRVRLQTEERLELNCLYEVSHD